MDLATRRLAVNADDFGFARDVNRGIVDAHLSGILTSTTLMANGGAFDDAVELASRHPALDIGVHGVLIGGNSLLDGRPFPLSVAELAYALFNRSIRPYEELRAQVDRILRAGLRPTHLDTHKHTHLLPPVLRAVARLSEEFQIRWVRRPFDLPLTGAPAEIPFSKRLVSRSFHLVRGHFHTVLTRHHCLMTDYFAGFQITGRLGSSDLVHLFRNLPAGTTEFMCHPGYCTTELRSMRTRLKDSRESELRALLHKDVRQAIQESGVELAPFPRLKS
ncbi:MAG: ChbG/HpnK family deacetylase [Bryobacterales bacterium]|nr:ChbG/HpnK family deacetylase [Bryobacterales bacterium]